VSDTSFFRRESQGPNKDMWHVVRVGVALWAFVFWPVVVPNLLSIYGSGPPQSVHVDNLEIGDDPSISKRRNIFGVIE
jgi:hypothetical protein